MSKSDRKHIGTGFIRTAKLFDSNDLVGCAMTLWPLIDDTARVATGDDRVGRRIKTFLNSNDVIVTYIALGSVYSASTVKGQTMFDVLYKECRNSVLHEGKEASIIEWTEDGSLSFGIGLNPNANQSHRLPHDLLFGMMMAVILAPCNRDAGPIGSNYGVTLGSLGLDHHVDELWGQRDYMMQQVQSRVARVR